MAGQLLVENSLVGQTLGHYHILQKLGAGGMGEVYLAHDAHLDREVAIKVLPPGAISDEHARKRFRKEAIALSKLNHPNIATIFDFDTQQGVDFLVMEYLTGITMSERLAAGRLPEREVIRLGVQLAEGLSAAHEQAVVHRDLKPGNLRLTADGRLKILDFGLAKLRMPAAPNAVTESLTETRGMAGTLPYMTPEQLLSGEIDARTDVHAAGSVLYEMATGERPFADLDDSQLIGAILSRQPLPPTKLNPKLSVELERIITKCLEKEPENRYQSAKELAVDLRRLRPGTSNAAATERKLSKRPRAKSMAVCVVILAVLMLLLLAFNLGHWRGRLLSRAQVPHIESLAVLPVKNFSGDPNQEFFADGMTDALIAGLAQINAVKVISRTSAMHYKGTNETLPQIAKELNVDGIVEASVVRSKDKLRLTVQLIDARWDRHLWARDYERDMTDVLALQSELVQAIAGEIRVRLTPQENERLKTARRVDPEVYDTTLKARATLDYATREGQIRQSIKLFQKAVDLDPTYAPAWAGLGEATWYLAAAGFEFVSPSEVRDRAIAASERALELDENLPEAHEARATIAVDAEWDVAKAQQHYERALELRPGYAVAHNLYGQILTVPLLQFDEARRHLDQARELDPLSPWNDINLIVWWGKQGRYERAIKEGERATLRNPSLWIIVWHLGLDRLALGQPSQAADEFEAALKLLQPDRPVSVLAPLGLAYGLMGRRADAAKILAEMERAAQKRYISPFQLAVVHSGLGQMDQAFRLLDQALEQRTPSLVYCTRHRADSVALRRDPRWELFTDRLRQLVRLHPGSAASHS
jgi:serine/threonine protein kinase/tetratricopeptide (TPR) repeat protein